MSPLVSSDARRRATRSKRRDRQCLILALKGPSTYACQCLLIGHERTCRGPALTAEFDPIQTLAPLPPRRDGIFAARELTWCVESIRGGAKKPGRPQQRAVFALFAVS